MNRWDVVVVGGGPAGLLAAWRASARGRTTLLLEKNRRPGAKILISGGGHCNLTHATDPRGIVAAFGQPGRFLHSALAALGPRQLVDLVEAEGVPTRVDPNGKVFPTSDKAADVLAAVLGYVRRSAATLAFDEPLVDVEHLGRAAPLAPPTESGAGGEGAFAFRLETARRTVLAKRVVLATGGCSYPGCGTTGDGYRWATALGHTILAPRPALVPLLTDAAWVVELQGITIPDAVVRVLADGGPAMPAWGSGASNAERDAGEMSPPGSKAKPLAQARGALLFTHFGLSGPVALDVSRAVSGLVRGQRPRLECDFLPGLSPTQVDESLAVASGELGRRRVATLLSHWLPGRLADALVVQAGVPPDRRGAELSRSDRRQLVEAMKRQTIRVSGTLGFDKAEVTAGGVSLDEVDSRSMESRLVPGLFIAGELLDLDGPIGGYNLQAAFSTGYLAGERV